MNWEQIKNDPAKLQELVNEYGVRGLAREVGVSHPTVLNYMKKHGVEVFKEKLGETEAKPKYEKTPTGYMVRYGKGYKVSISEEELDELLSLYCVARLTLNQVAIRTGLTRQEVYAIKTAFSITKDSMPFTPEQIDQHTPYELAEKLRTKKLQYAFQQYDTNKYADIERRVKEMDKTDYWYNELCKRVNKIQPKPYKLNPKLQSEEAVYVAYIADVHAGLEVDSYFNTYNIDIMHQRFNTLANEIAANCDGKIYLCDLGDTVHGIIHGSTQKYSTWVTHATTEVIKAYEQLFVTLLELGYEVYFAKVNGNHESIEKTKTDRTEEESFGNVIYDMLKWKYSDQGNLHFIDKVKGLNATIVPLFNYSTLLIHGDNGSLKTLEEAKVLFQSCNVKEINAGHIHQRQIQGNVYYNEAFCGSDQYAGSKFLVSERGTRIVKYTREGRVSETLVRY